MELMGTLAINQDVCKTEDPYHNFISFYLPNNKRPSLKFKYFIIY